MGSKEFLEKIIGYGFFLIFSHYFLLSIVDKHNFTIHGLFYARNENNHTNLQSHQHIFQNNFDCTLC